MASQNTIERINPRGAFRRGLRRRAVCAAVFAMVCGCPHVLRAQGPGGSLPPIEIENVTVIGKRMVVLPKARKGEVLDTSIYVLPAGDSLLFTQRISNLGGAAGPLPGYREFESPLRLDAEASIGSYLSPRAMVRGEYVRSAYDITALLDARSTSGHIDGAKATSALASARGSLLVGDDMTPLGRFRLSAGGTYAADAYTLYGAQTAPADRDRTGTTLEIGLRGEGNARLQYALALEIASTDVEDSRGDTTRTMSALTPAFNVELGMPIDSVVDVRARLNFSSTSLRYAAPSQTPSAYALLAEAGWRPTPSLTLTGGLTVASAENSDSGSARLVMPRVTIRYAADSDISIVAAFEPELRPASYRERIMQAPYVDGDIELRAERVPVAVALGVNVNNVIGTHGDEPSRLSARLFYEITEQTPVVDASDGGGRLRYRHVDAERLGADVSLHIPFDERWRVMLGLRAQSVRDRADDQPLPMTPAFDLRARVDYALPVGGRTLNLFADATVMTEQQVVVARLLGPSDALPAPLATRFLVGVGAEYRVAQYLTVVAEASNLLGLRYDAWKGYSAPGLEVRGGIRLNL